MIRTLFKLSATLVRNPFKEVLDQSLQLIVNSQNRELFVLSRENTDLLKSYSKAF